MTALPPITGTMFLFAVAWALFWWYRASRSALLLASMLVIGAVQWTLANTGFYHVPTGMPPRQMLLLLPGLLPLLITLLLPAGRRWMRSWALVPLVMVHVLRIPVEFVLHHAWRAGLVPQSMTYSGHDLDILSGISAAFMVAWLLSRRPPGRAVLIGWNLACLVLLVIVVITAVGSIPSALQRWNFDRPNVLVLDAPYVLLPGLLVPAVLWSHAALLLKLFRPGAPEVTRA